MDLNHRLPTPCGLLYQLSYIGKTPEYAALGIHTLFVQLPGI